MRRRLTADDIMELGAYAAERANLRREMIATKRRRRVALGPHAMVYFESYETMRHQVHEMLYIEQGVNTGRPIDNKAVANQLRDELAAYNPLIPNGSELVATIMFEIENEARRDTLLDSIGNIETSFSLTVAGEVIAGVPETDTDRTNQAGRASSVQFVHFPFTPEQCTRFAAPGAAVTLGCSHSNYPHMTRLSPQVITELARDFHKMS